MVSLLHGVKSALSDPKRSQTWFRQLFHNNIFAGDGFHVVMHETQSEPDTTSHSTTQFSDFESLAESMRVANDSQANPRRAATFKLLRLHSLRPWQFLSLLELCNIDQAALLVLNSGPFHFQYFGADAKATGNPANVTFGLAYNVATILWSSDLMTGAVRAIAVGDDDRPFDSMQIEQYKPDLTQPLAPALLALQVQLDALHGENRKLVASLREIEKKTGHRKDQSAATMDLDQLVHRDLDDITQSVSNIHYKAISQKRTFVAIRGIVQEMSETFDEQAQAKHIRNNGSGDNAFRTALSWRLKSIDSLLEQINYLLDRIGIQENVVINLRSKRDAETSIMLAESSKMLAARALEDSSSMKTVAVITMALLPGTFFAALFAMPLLKWDENPVVQDRFWVYLAFTLPSTVAVFSLWAVITKTDILPRLGRALIGWTPINADGPRRSSHSWGNTG